MKWLGLLLVAVSAACSTPDEQSAAPAAMMEGVAVAGAEAADSVVYVDVRTPEEYRAGHVRGAVLIPHDQMEKRWQELESYRDRPMVLYCRSGRRSGIAIDVLRAHGFTNITNGGGLEQMSARGLPITTSE